MKRGLALLALALLVGISGWMFYRSWSNRAPDYVSICYLAGKDLVVREAVVVGSSGNLTFNEDIRASLIGSRIPPPVAWTSAFWTATRVIEGKDEEKWRAANEKWTRAGSPFPSCAALNQKLCGQDDCRMAG